MDTVMIHLGLDQVEKNAVLTDYCAKNGIKKVFVFSPARFRLCLDFNLVEYIEWKDIIRYVFYYRILQETGKDTLLVINECLRTQNRNDLTYNCLKNFINQTSHVIVFQYLPVIDTIDDFMILFDFVTRSRWRRERFDRKLMTEARLQIEPVRISFQSVRIPVDEKISANYLKERENVFAEVRSDPEKDPHLIPRRLHLVSGKTKARAVPEGRSLVGRNNRFALPLLETYQEVSCKGDRTIFEFCHNFIVFSDYLAVARPSSPIEALVADTKADRWYFDRYVAWSGRIEDAYATLLE